MQMEEGLDTGPMLMKWAIEIDNKNAGELTDELAKLGATLIRGYLAGLPKSLGPQPAEGVTYASKVDKSEAHIDWTAPAEKVERQVRAFNPMPGAWFEANGERVKLLRAEIELDSRFRGNDGMVLDDGLLIACGEGAIRPMLVQRAGRGPMSTDELLRGFAIPKGTILP